MKFLEEVNITIGSFTTLLGNREEEEVDEKVEENFSRGGVERPPP